MTTEENEPRIIVDEDWKARVEAEKEQLRHPKSSSSPDEVASPSERSTEPADLPELAQESAERTSGNETPRADQSDPPPKLPPATFDSLIETLAMQAMASLNEAMQPADATEKTEGMPDPRFHLEMAKYLIDTLAVLEAKTRGNLTSEEALRLEKVLHDLRMGFVAVRRQVL